ncbi:adenosylcobyric acid synthase (glutamine-hydrolysing) [Selenomonas sp. GACV-9]|uniref:cobyric acid synthase n=1 Tax=Selenomonas sp. GACV-9 TaxID=3158782 RepID=UPI0008E52691|nr:adenosylcobyric acid synthase (glutamine-hydrolysing) [Selenomonas ruminantium]
MSNAIMLMGTSSHVGKSIITTALCRIFHQQGRKVVPFKAQNMALNSYVTRDGKEMGRAQVAQAEAAGLEPMVDMNPVLLKPTGNSCSQVVLNGEPIGNMSAREYHKGYSLKAFDAVKAALGRLQAGFDTLVIEGAGSPAEVNLKANDIVNMRVAKYLDAPVLLIADIDRGGALASLVGTLELLDEEERALVKGLVINKFRGDVSLLTPAVDFLEQKTGKPVLGIVPHIDALGIDDEDSVSLEEKQAVSQDAPISIAVIQTPKLSNFTDFDSLAAEPDVSLYYVKSVEELGEPDLILLPGSKNTTEDLLYLRESGIEAAIRQKVEQGTPLWGICGGYQMLGRAIHDPLHTESAHDSVTGMGYLAMETTFAASKLTTQVTADCVKLPFLGRTLMAEDMPGYEIHMGKTEFGEGVQHPFHITAKADTAFDGWDGAYAVAGQGEVVGTYIHGIFDHDGFRRQLINALRERKGLAGLSVQRNVRMEKEKAYNHLADVVRQSLDMEKLAQIMGETTC